MGRTLRPRALPSSNLADVKPAPPEQSFHWWRILLACAVVFSGCSRHATSGNPAPEPTPKIADDKIAFEPNAPQLAYVAAEPAQAQHAVASSLNGRLAWDDDVTARVFSPVSGRIIEAPARSGQRIALGDTLARLKSPDFGQAQADARKAAADASLAARALERSRDLFAHHAAAQKDVEAAEADHARAVSEQERALAALALYGGEGAAPTVTGLFELKAPVGGVIVERNVSPGQEVRSDQVGADSKPLFVVSDPTRLWLWLDVTEADLAALAPDQEVIVHVRALPSRTFSGRLEVIADGLDPVTHTIKARCLVGNPDKLLRAEMYVNADVLADPKPGVDVPTKALFTKNTQQFAFVETAPGRFERRAVKVAVETSNRSVVVEGVASGERVVVEGALLLEALLEGANS